MQKFLYVPLLWPNRLSRCLRCVSCSPNIICIYISLWYGQRDSPVFPRCTLLRWLHTAAFPTMQQHGLWLLLATWDHCHWLDRDMPWNSKATEAILGHVRWVISHGWAHREGGPHYHSCLHAEGNPGSYTRNTRVQRNASSEPEPVCTDLLWTAISMRWPTSAQHATRTGNRSKQRLLCRMRLQPSSGKLSALICSHSMDMTTCWYVIIAQSSRLSAASLWGSPLA